VRLDEGMVVRSGGGEDKFHVHYRSGELIVRNRVKIQGLIDVRSHGGLIVVPGSVHPETGGRYEFETHYLPVAELSEPPAALVELLRDKPVERTIAGVRTAAANVTDPFRRALAYVRSDRTPGAVSHQGGHNRTYWLA